MVHNFKDNEFVMYLVVPTYSLNLLDLNESLRHVYVESDKQTGGGREVVKIRNSGKGFPLTLRDNFSEKGYLTLSSEASDIRRAEREISKIASAAIGMGVLVCVPIQQLAQEIQHVEKSSPRLAGYVTKRLKSIQLLR